MLRLILPVRLLQGVDHRLEVPAQAVRKINEAAEVTPVIAEILPMGTLLEVMHHGGLRADMVAVEAAGKDGGFSRELLLTVRAHAAVEAVEDPLRFPGSAVDDRPVCLFSYRVSLSSKKCTNFSNEKCTTPLFHFMHYEHGATASPPWC